MFKNWKTTITGIAGFILAGCTAKGWITAEQSAALLSAIVGLLGILSKDSDVTECGTIVRSHEGKTIKNNTEDL